MDLLPAIIDSEPALGSFRAAPGELDGPIRAALCDCVRRAVEKAGG